MSDEELADAIAPGDPRRFEMVAKLTPEKRATIEKLIWVGEELNAGRLPPGVIACGHREVRP